MSPRPVNIEITGTDLPGRLVHFRERRHLTKSELASRANVSYRTVHELESGRRERIQEKTLLLLAEALAVSPHELCGAASGSIKESGTDPEVSKRRVASGSKRRVPMQAYLPASVLLLVAIVLGTVVWIAGAAGANWAVVDGKLEVRHGILGHELWRYSSPGSVLHVEVSPWSNRILLVRTREADPAASPLLAVDRRSGRILWSVTPDLSELTRAFGHEIMQAGSMYPVGTLVADIRGDGEPVLVVNFRQTVYYPTSLCAVDRRGRLIAQYNSKGYIFDMLAVDIDGRGKDVVLATGTNNDPAYQGATVILLDDGHFRGATTDTMSAPISSLPDSARYRLVLPMFPEPYMQMVGLGRLHATRPQLLRLADGSIGFNVCVGGSEQVQLIVFLDAQLRPLRAAPADVFLGFMQRAFPDSLKGTGPADPHWMQEWLSSHVRFEAGH
jgi:transcriptional regulator with XRE-family HTH domain